MKSTLLNMQVIENTVKWMARVPGQQVFRARFSAISAPEITAAMVLRLTHHTLHAWDSVAICAPSMPLKDLQPCLSVHRALGR